MKVVRIARDLSGIQLHASSDGARRTTRVRIEWGGPYFDFRMTSHFTIPNKTLKPQKEKKNENPPASAGLRSDIPARPHGLPEQDGLPTSSTRETKKT